MKKPPITPCNCVNGMILEVGAFCEICCGIVKRDYIEPLTAKEKRLQNIELFYGLSTWPRPFEN